MPTRPPTFHEKYLGGRKATDALYNGARQHDPHEQAIHSRRWQKVRRMAWQRDGGLCVTCRAQDRQTEAIDVHHIQPRATHPELTYDLDNLISLCRACHNRTGKQA